MNTKYFALVMGILLVACSGATESPKTVMSEAEIREWQTEAIAFGDRGLGAWPDIDQLIAEFAEDATVSHPSMGFFFDGKRSIIHYFQI